MLQEGIKKVQIRNNSLLYYTQYERSGRSIANSSEYGHLTATKLDTFEKEAYSGTLTSNSIKRLRKAVSLLVESTTTRPQFNPVTKKTFKFKLSFITLTIPDNTKLTASEAHKQLLEPMIKHLRQVHGMRSYVWKAEIQKRGQLHYHLTSDCFIVHSDLKNKWNQLIRRAGLMEEYKAKYNSEDPNSTDIHSVKKIGDLAAYLVKYFTKTEQNGQNIGGKVWDCSKNIKAGKYYSTDLDPDIEYMIASKTTEQNSRTYQSDYFTLTVYKGVKPIDLFPTEIKERYYQNLASIREGESDLFTVQKVSTVVPELGQLPTYTTTIPKYTPNELFIFSSQS